MKTDKYEVLAWASGIGAFAILIALPFSIWCNPSSELNTILWIGFGLLALISLISIIGKNKEEEELKAKAKRAIRLKKLQKEQSELIEYKKIETNVIDSKILVTSEGKMIYYLIVRYPHTKKIKEFKVEVEEYYYALETKKHILYYWYVPKEKREQYHELEHRITSLIEEENTHIDF